MWHYGSSASVFCTCLAFQTGRCWDGAQPLLGGLCVALSQPLVATLGVAVPGFWWSSLCSLSLGGAVEG